MKSVLQLMQMDHKHMQHELCHPRRQAAFNNDAIQRKIDQIREKKQQLRVDAQRKRVQVHAKRQRYSQFPLQRIHEQSLQVLDESISLIIRRKIEFIEQKVYIGTKNNINSEYISRVNDSNEAKPALKNQLSLFMEDLVSNLETDIVNGSYEIVNKKDLIIPKHQQNLVGPNEPNATKLIQIKKVELSNKIEELKDELTKTELQHQNLSPILSKQKSFSMRAASATGSIVGNSLNIQDFSIKSQRTKQAQNFVKKLQKEQEEQRRQRKRREQQLKKMQVKSQVQKREIEQHLRIERHEKLKIKFQKQRKQKLNQYQKANKVKADFQNFLSDYRKRIPLYKEKELKFKNQKEKQEKKKAMSVLTEIKEAKRSIDINELKQHQNKYKVIKSEFEKEKMTNLKHRQKEIHLRQKQDKLYFRGRYHSLIKEQLQKEPEDPTVKRDELLKKQKEYGQKVKKQFVPVINQNKQKQLEQLIYKMNKNKPNLESKDQKQIGNKYLSDLHKLVKQIKAEGKSKVQLPEEIKPRYRDYLQDLKLSRNYQTISYDRMNDEDMQKYAAKVQQSIRKKEKLLAITDEVDIEKQLKQIDELDMELLRSAQIKAKLVERYDPRNEEQPSDQQNQLISNNL